MEVFYLDRSDDVGGVSGTGVVAVGVVLPSGRCVLEWCSRWRTVTVFDSLGDIQAIHGHGGRTVLRYGLPPPLGWTGRGGHRGTVLLWTWNAALGTAFLMAARVTRWARRLFHPLRPSAPPSSAGNTSDSSPGV